MNLEGRFSVLFISGYEGHVQRDRCLHQQEQLKLIGIPTEVRSHRDPEQLSDTLDYDLFIFHCVPYSELVSDTLELIEEMGKVAIFGTDDLLLEPDLRLLDTLPPEEARRYAQALQAQAATLARCPYALASTCVLAAWLQERRKVAFISRTSLSAEMLVISEDAYAHRSRRGPHSPVILGYFSDGRSQQRDFGQLAPALARVLERYPHLELHLGGHLDLSPELAPFQHRIQRTPDVLWRERPYLVAGVDINLAPLDLDSPFCQARSELKYLEAAAVGVPTIASPTRAFEHTIAHGGNGLLAGTTEEWIGALELLIEDGDQRAAMGEQAREDVYRRYAPEVRGRELVMTLEKIQRDWAGQHGSRGLSQPERAVIHRLQGQIARQREQMEAQEFQLACLRQAVPPWEEASPREAALRKKMARREAELREEIARREAELEKEIGRREAELRKEIARREAELRKVLLWVRRGRRSPWALLWARAKRLAKSVLRRHYTSQLHGRSIRPGEELAAGKSCGQVFLASQPGLRAIVVLFGTHRRLNTPDVIFHLRDSPTSEADLITRSICAALLRDNEFHRFAFDPIPDSKGCSFYFELESPEGVPGDGVSVWSYLDSGPEGCTRYQDGEPTWGLVVFRDQYSADVTGRYPGG